MKEKLKLSLVQTDIVWESIDSNLSHYEDLLSGVEEGTDLVILPELFTTGFTMEVRKLSEKMNDKTFKWMKQKAVEYNVSLTGSFICSEKSKFYNRLLWMNPTGEFFFYDKRHLFRMGQENKFYNPGNRKLVVNFGKWKICPLICYDLRFPVWSRNAEAYDLLIYVANWPAVRSHVWNILSRARAIENQCYVAAVNRIGKDGQGIRYSGESMVIDPKGFPINQISKNKPGMITCEIDLSGLNEFRKKFPLSEDADKFAINY